MYLVADSLDDLMRAVFTDIREKGESVVASKGATKELFGVVLELNAPIVRLSRTEMKGRLYSALGELLWYLSGSDDFGFIDYYLKDGYEAEPGTSLVWGAYGPRLLKMRGSINQLEQVQSLLQKKRSSRQAVIQLFDAADIVQERKDVPCTCTLQFVIRGTGLDLFVSMRSNDAYRGLPHDIFAFTMIQELVARELGVTVGRYKHAVGSLHLYDVTEEKVAEFLAEGWHEPTPMPPMPEGSQWHQVQIVLAAESQIRAGQDVDVGSLSLNDYWADIVRLLQVYPLTRGGAAKHNEERLRMIAKAMTSPFYKIYVGDRIKKSLAAEAV
jgi:thymidylate synthase